jgi:hypothetical protein
MRAFLYTLKKNPVPPSRGALIELHFEICDPAASGIVVVVLIMTTDPKKLASNAWMNAPSWREAAREYHDARAGRPLIVEIEPERLKRLRNLLKDSTPFLAAYYEIARRDGGAPQPTVEGRMFSLRSRGTRALEEPATKRRLCELSDQQMIEVGDRLQKLKPEIARAWSTEEVKLLLRARIK